MATETPPTSQLVTLDAIRSAASVLAGIAVQNIEAAREGEEPRDLVARAERVLERLKELGVNRIGN